MNAIYHLIFEQDIDIFMVFSSNFQLPLFTRVISCNSLQPKRGQGRKKLPNPNKCTIVYIVVTYRVWIKY